MAFFVIRRIAVVRRASRVVRLCAGLLHRTAPVPAAGARGSSGREGEGCASFAEAGEIAQALYEVTGKVAQALQKQVTFCKSICRNG